MHENYLLSFFANRNLFQPVPAFPLTTKAKNKPSETREAYSKAESAMRECLTVVRVAVFAREIFIYATITSLKRKRKLILQLTGYKLCR